MGNIAAWSQHTAKKRRKEESSDEEEEPEVEAGAGVLDDVHSAAEEARSAESVISSEDDPTKAAFVGMGKLNFALPTDQDVVTYDSIVARMEKRGAESSL